MRALVDEHSKRADDAGKLARCLGEVLDQLDTLTAELAAEKDRANTAESALETEQAKVKAARAQALTDAADHIDGFEVLRLQGGLPAIDQVRLVLDLVSDRVRSLDDDDDDDSPEVAP